jgi:3-oxoacyl-[acyl-carrier-protein] synthase III
MPAQVGIVAAACCLPPGRRSAADLLTGEGGSLMSSNVTRIGIDEVPAIEGETGSALALAAARQALERAGMTGAQLDVIVDYTTLPQDYLVPAWNMSNRLQHELGASKAFTVGFSGGGASNFLVALASAVALLQVNEKLQTALLVASDLTLPENRVLHPEDPVSVLGDAAGAVVLRRDAAANLVLDSEFLSEGALHDVCYIPGGALAHPDDPELYRLELDKQRYDSAAKSKRLRQMTDCLLKRAGLSLNQITFALYPNLSREDQAEFQQALELKDEQMCLSALSSHGHLQGTDFVVNYLAMLESSAVKSGDYFLAASHGMGFLPAVSLFRA